MINVWPVAIKKATKKKKKKNEYSYIVNKFIVVILMWHIICKYGKNNKYHEILQHTRNLVKIIDARQV
jgi:hypothetical protein